jgi:hypothetical protein
MQGVGFVSAEPLAALFASRGSSIVPPTWTRRCARGWLAGFGQHADAELDALNERESARCRSFDQPSGIESST